MTEAVKVRTLRLHHGDGGTRKEGQVYETTLQHAKQLGTLVEIVDEKAAPVPDNKAQPAPPNKAEPKPDNKSRAPAKVEA